MPIIDLNFADSFYPFEGDGRTKVSPAEHVKSWSSSATPQSLTRAAARLLVSSFNEKERITLEESGAHVWVIETWAWAQNVEIKIVKHPFGGWFVKYDKLPEGNEEEELEDGETFDERLRHRSQVMV